MKPKESLQLKEDDSDSEIPSSISSDSLPLFSNPNFDEFGR